MTVSDDSPQEHVAHQMEFAWAEGRFGRVASTLDERMSEEIDRDITPVVRPGQGVTGSVLYRTITPAVGDVSAAIVVRMLVPPRGEQAEPGNVRDQLVTRVLLMRRGRFAGLVALGLSNGGLARLPSPAPGSLRRYGPAHLESGPPLSPLSPLDADVLREISQHGRGEVPEGTDEWWMLDAVVSRLLAQPSTRLSIRLTGELSVPPPDPLNRPAPQVGFLAVLMGTVGRVFARLPEGAPADYAPWDGSFSTFEAPMPGGARSTLPQLIFERAGSHDQPSPFAHTVVDLGTAQTVASLEPMHQQAAARLLAWYRDDPQGLGKALDRLAFEDWSLADRISVIASGELAAGGTQRPRAAVRARPREVRLSVEQTVEAAIEAALQPIHQDLARLSDEIDRLKAEQARNELAQPLTSIESLRSDLEGVRSDLEGVRSDGVEVRADVTSVYKEFRDTASRLTALHHVHHEVRGPQDGRATPGEHGGGGREAAGASTDPPWRGEARAPGEGEPPEQSQGRWRFRYPSWAPPWRTLSLGALILGVLILATVVESGLLLRGCASADGQGSTGTRVAPSTPAPRTDPTGDESPSTPAPSRPTSPPGAAAHNEGDR